LEMVWTAMMISMIPVVKHAAARKSVNGRFLLNFQTLMGRSVQSPCTHKGRRQTDARRTPGTRVSHLSMGQDACQAPKLNIRARSGFPSCGRGNGRQIGRSAPAAPSPRS
jgi:hypothetical protein